MKRKKPKDEARAFLDSLLNSREGYVPMYCREHGKTMVKDGTEKPVCGQCGAVLRSEDDNLTHEERRKERKRRVKLLRQNLEG
jgi:hypothetical protein